MIQLSSTELSKILSIPALLHTFNFKGLSTDTRTLEAGNLFIALKGESIDGNLYLEEARKKGAVAALVNQETASTLPQLVVPDTLNAFGLLAQNWRQRFNIPLVGLTGSNGKTTLKNLVASILRAACQPKPETVLATEANFNNHIGVPMMLSKLDSAHRYAVIEMGMNHFGELTYLASLALPTVAIINNAAPAHLSGVIDLDGVAKAKGEIFTGLAANGTAILNADDKYYSYWKGLIGKRASYSFGMSSTADVHALIHDSKDPLKQNITIITPKDRIDVLLPLLGKHNVMNAVAATAVAVALNCEASAIKQGLESILAANGRLQMHSYAHDIRLIDDTYNANPASVTAAINVLAAFSGNKILILGDMGEMGEGAPDIHANMVKIIRDAGITQLYTYGDYAKEISKNFGGNALHFQEQASLMAALREEVKPNSTFLVKGARKMKMEKVVEAMKEVLQ